MDFEARLRQHLHSTGEDLAPPPASLEAPLQRAAVRQRRRRALGSSCAALALIAGGVAAYQIADTGRTQDIVAIGSEEDSGSGETPTSTNGATSGQAGSGVDGLTLPEGDGPMLEWNEVDPGAEFRGGQLVWAGDAFVTLSYSDQGSVLMRSTNGADWSPIPGLPTDVDLWGVQADGSSLLVWGSERLEVDTASSVFEQPAGRVFVSFDVGAGWSELDLPTPTIATTSPYLRSFNDIGGAAIAGEVALVGLMNHLEPDIEMIVAGKGVEASPSSGYSVGGGEIGICADDACNRHVTFTYDELGFSEEEIAALESGMGSSAIYRSAGGGALRQVDVGDGEGFADAVLAADGEFFICFTANTGGQSLHGSADGLSWDLRHSNDSGTNSSMGGLASDGTALFAQVWSTDGAGMRRSDDGGRTWTTIGPTHPGLGQIVGGPGGLAVSGQLFDDDAPVGLDEGFDPIVVEKDGYVITWSDASLTLIDSATGDVVLEFGPEQMSADEPPETVIENDDGFTLLHPDTLEPLVTIDFNDLEPTLRQSSTGVTTIVPNGEVDNGSVNNEAVAEEAMIEEGTADSTDFADGVYDMPESFLGWSADGTNWSWQTTTDAFGINGWAQLAVGNGIVVAIVDDPTFWEENPGSEAEYEIPASRVFVATTN